MQLALFDGEHGSAACCIPLNLGLSCAEAEHQTNEPFEVLGVRA